MKTYTRASTTTVICTRRNSELKMPTTVLRPSPFMLKAVSTTTEPPTRAPTLTAAAVRSEKSDGRRAWPNRMRGVLRPLARAVVMKSDCKVLMRSERRRRMYVAAKGAANTMVGRKKFLKWSNGESKKLTFFERAGKIFHCTVKKRPRTVAST